MALDMLLIPAVSADPECLFSDAKIVLSNRRGTYTLEALECLKSWLKISTFIKDDEDDGWEDGDIMKDTGTWKLWRS